MKRSYYFLSLVLLLVASSVASAQMGPTSLKEAYEPYFSVGVAVNLRNISDPTQAALVKRNFNSITAENVMKPGLVQPYQGEFDWEDADKIADYCRENGIKLRGHCLMWHNQTGDWFFKDDNGKYVSKEVLFDRMKTHIFAVMNRYKDVVYCWDVVNEAINNDSTSSNALRTTSGFWEVCHSDEWIKKAFEYAREADPNALLYYNDYNECDPIKRQRIYNLVKKMKAEGVPIDGIGMQCHYNIYGPSAEEVDKTIKMFSQLVNHIHITELDVRLTDTKGGNQRMNQPREVVLKEEDLKMQEEYYAKIFKVFRDNKKYIDTVTFWNLADADSWLGRHNAPLLFDFNYRPKQVYRTVLNFQD